MTGGETSHDCTENAGNSDRQQPSSNFASGLSSRHQRIADRVAGLIEGLGREEMGAPGAAGSMRCPPKIVWASKRPPISDLYMEILASTRLWHLQTSGPMPKHQTNSAHAHRTLIVTSAYHTRRALAISAAVCRNMSGAWRLRPTWGAALGKTGRARCSRLSRLAP
jgi:hypothetical protein